MPWNSETNHSNPPKTIDQLLAEINTKQLAIRTQLNTIVSQKNACALNTGIPHSVGGMGKHGNDPNGQGGDDPLRSTAYSQVASALASLGNAEGWVAMSINQLSHQGGSSGSGSKPPPPPPGLTKPTGTGGASSPGPTGGYGGSSAPSAAPAAKQSGPTSKASSTGGKPSAGGGKPTGAAAKQGGTSKKPSGKGAKRSR